MFISSVYCGQRIKFESFKITKAAEQQIENQRKKNIWKKKKFTIKMEAVAKHDFNATADDELSFRKNQILKVSIL